MLGSKKQQTTARRRPPERNSGARAYSYYGNAGGETRTTSSAHEKSIDLGRTGSRLRLVPTVVALLVIIGSVLFSLTLSTQPSVTMPEGSEAVYRSLDDYAAAAEELLSQKLANRTKLTANTSETERALLELFPELDAAVLRLPVLGRRPNLVVSVSQPVMLLATTSKTFVINRSGMAVSELSKLADGAKQGLPVVKDQSGLELKVGQAAVTTETVSFILSVRAHLAAANLSVSELTLPARVNELDIRLENIRYYVKMDTSGDARLQAGSFLAVKENLAGKGITPVEYIDVRVEEKVFYK